MKQVNEARKNKGKKTFIFASLLGRQRRRVGRRRVGRRTCPDSSVGGTKFKGSCCRDLNWLTSIVEFFKLQTHKNEISKNSRSSENTYSFNKGPFFLSLNAMSDQAGGLK